MTKHIAAALLALIATGALAEPGTVINSGNGRYAVGQISSYRQDQYLLDTQTGRLWSFVCTKKDSMNNCAQMALQQMPFLDPNGNISGLSPSALPAGKF